MADPIAEAFVRIRPDLKGFDEEVKGAIDKAVGGSKVSSGSQKNVATQIFGTGFQQETKTKVTGAVDDAGKNIPPTTGRNIAAALFGPGFRNESGRAIQGVLAGAGAGQLAARFAFFGAGGAALAVLAEGFLASAQAAAKFETSINTLRVVADLTDEELRDFSKAARDLGADVSLPGVTAQEAADAFTELAKAGLAAADVLAAGRGVLQLSIAANVDAASAAKILAAALNAFSLAGTEATHVADLLAGASIAAQGDIGDMALALQQSSAVANQAGLSIEQLVGLITELAQKGILGSDAGTSIRTALLRLVPTTKEAAQIMEVLGIQLDQTRTLGQQLPELLDQYKESLDRLNPTARQAALLQIFGTDAIRSATIAIEGGSEALRRSTDAANRQGAAADIAAAKAEGLGGAMEGLKSTVETLATNFGLILSPALEEFIRTLTEMIQPVNDAVAALQKLEEIDIPEIKIPGLPGFDIPEIPGGDIFKGISKEVVDRAVQGLVPFGVALNQIPVQANNARVALAALGVEFGDGETEVEAITRKIEELNEALFAGGTTRGQRIAIQAQIAQLETLLAGAEKRAKQARKTFEGLLDPITGEADFLIGPLTQIEDQLDDFIDPNVLGKQLQTALKQLQDPSLGTEARKVLVLIAQSLIKDLAKMGPEGERVLRAAGARIMEGLAEGITETEQRAIDAARASLERIRTEGERQVQEAIRSARANLEGLGGSIGDALEDVFAAGPAPANIRRQIQQVVRNVEQGLRFNLRQARADLATAQRSISQIGVLTPAQARAQRAFLAPFKASLGDAKRALSEFSTDEAITEIEQLEEKIQDLQDAVTRRQLRFDLSVAQADLREAKASLDIIGEATPEQKRAQQEFLEPFRQKILDTKAAAAEFNLEQARQEFEDTQAAAAKAADEGIQKLVEQFQEGKISAGEFNRLLRNQLGPAFDILKTKAGLNLGLAFTRDFKRDVEALIEQAKALSGFFPLGGGTAPGATVVRPAETQAQVNQRIADAAASLAQIQKDAIKKSDEEQEKMTVTNGLLRKILKAVGGEGPGPGRG